MLPCFWYSCLNFEVLESQKQGCMHVVSALPLTVFAIAVAVMP